MDANIRSYSPTKGLNLIRALQHCYVFHSTYGTSCYPDSILVTLLQFDYLKRVDHPVLKTFLLDSTISVEEHGEITLSLLANAMLNSTHKSEYAALLRAYQAVGSGAELSKENLASLGVSNKRREHCSSGHQHRSTVDALRPHLRTLANELIMNKRMHVFKVDDDNVEETKIKPDARLTYVRTLPLFYKRNTTVDVDGHGDTLRDRYVDNSEHPQVAATLLGIVGDARYVSLNRP